MIDTGKLKARIAIRGSGILESLSIDDREIAKDAHLVCIAQDGPEGNAEDTVQREKYISKVEKVTAEQTGPVRAVFKIEGKHKGVKTLREWLPFVVRLYFYAGRRGPGRLAPGGGHWRAGRGGRRFPGCRGRSGEVPRRCRRRLCGA